MKTTTEQKRVTSVRSEGEKPSLVRLRRVAQPGRALAVDRTFPGSIRGLSAIMTGEALGHGFEIDELTVSQIGAALGGVPGRWTHGGLSDDGLARHLGRWTARGVEAFDLCRGCQLHAPLPPEGGQAACPGCGRYMEHAMRALGDFQFSESAHKIKPDGLDVSAPVYLMDRAEEDPKTLGVSVVARFDFEEKPELGEDGKTVVNVRRIARLKAGGKALERADFVADPAANPLGLHRGTGTLSELSEEAATQLDRIVERLGADKARERALSFLDRYFDAKGATKMKPIAITEGSLSPAQVEQQLAAKKAAKKAASKADQDEDAKDGGEDEEDEGEDPSEDDEENEDLSASCPKCSKKLKALEAELSKAVDHNAELRSRFATSRLEEARKAANEAGNPIDPETANSITALLTRGDAESQKLGEQMIKLAIGNKPDAKSKPFAQLANPGLRKAEDVAPAKTIQEQMLSTMGYERTPEGELRKKK